MISDRIKRKLEELDDKNFESALPNDNERKKRIAELEKLAELYSDIVPEEYSIPYNHFFVTK